MKPIERYKACLDHLQQAKSLLTDIEQWWSGINYVIKNIEEPDRAVLNMMSKVIVTDEDHED